jgi:elongation factor 3
LSILFFPSSASALSTTKKLTKKYISPWATPLILPSILNQIETAGKWQVKTGCLTLLDTLVKSSAEQMAKLMPEIVPTLSGAIWDTKAEVKKAARASLTNATALVSNKDIEKSAPSSLRRSFRRKQSLIISPPSLSLSPL